MRILVVEDHTMFREAVVRQCARKGDHRVVGETGSGVDAWRMIQSLGPDLIILDLGLEDMSGLQLILKMW